ncbi:MAG: hypothetical protein RLT05_09230, partial [Bauldia litoralis]
DYAEFSAHVQEHKAFLEWLRSVGSALSLDPQAQFYLAQTIKSYLREWLDKHILKSDMGYKPVLAGNARNSTPTQEVESAASVALD